MHTLLTIAAQDFSMKGCDVHLCVLVRPYGLRESHQLLDISEQELRARLGQNLIGL